MAAGSASAAIETRSTAAGSVRRDEGLSADSRGSRTTATAEHEASEGPHGGKEPDVASESFRP